MQCGSKQVAGGGSASLRTCQPLRPAAVPARGAPSPQARRCAATASLPRPCTAGELVRCDGAGVEESGLSVPRPCRCQLLPRLAALCSRHTGCRLLSTNHPTPASPWLTAAARRPGPSLPAAPRWRRCLGWRAPAARAAAPCRPAAQQSCGPPGPAAAQTPPAAQPPPPLRRGCGGMQWVRGPGTRSRGRHGAALRRSRCTGGGCGRRGVLQALPQAIVLALQRRVDGGEGGQFAFVRLDSAAEQARQASRRPWRRRLAAAAAVSGVAGRVLQAPWPISGHPAAAARAKAAREDAGGWRSGPQSHLVASSLRSSSTSATMTARVQCRPGQRQGATGGPNARCRAARRLPSDL